MDNENNDFLKITIEYKNNISLLKFKDHLEGWYNQYKKHLANNNISENDDSLLIKDIKEGSIEIYLIPAAVFLFSNINTIVSFYDNIKRAYNWLTTLKGTKPKYDAEELINLKNILSPIINNDNSLTINLNGDVNFTTVIDNLKAKKISENVNNELLTLSTPPTEQPEIDLSVMEKVLLLFNQVENAEKNTKSTKGIIKEIDSKAHPIYFEEGLKHKMILAEVNPLRLEFLVDVKIHRERENINAYTVLKLIDTNYRTDVNDTENELF